MSRPMRGWLGVTGIWESPRCCCEFHGAPAARTGELSQKVFWNIVWPGQWSAPE